jgi:predicted ferric reductase
MQSESSRPLYRGAQVVWYSLYIIETLLIVRFLLKLLGANGEAAFTNLVYSTSNIFVWPFMSVFSNDYVSSSVFEWTTLLALAVYWLLATAIVKLFVMSKSVSPREADVRLSDSDAEIL